MLKKMTISDLPKRVRDVESSFETLPEWPKLKAILDKGLGEAEAWDLFVSDAQAEQHGLTHRRTGPRFLKKYIKEIGKRYSVKSVKGADGVHYQVSNPAVIVTKQRKHA